MKHLLLASLGVLLFAGCRTRDLGTGINKATRDYAKAPEDTHEAAVSTCKDVGFQVDLDQHDKLGGKIAARRGDGSKVEITTQQVNPDMARVSIWIEPGNVDLANDLHERIAEKLGLSPSSGGIIFGGSSVSGRYPIDLKAGINAARRTYRALDFHCTREWQNQDLAEVDGRMQDSRPLRIRMEQTSDGLEVTFIAGTSKNDDNKTFANRMKAEFERHAAP